MQSCDSWIFVKEIPNRKKRLVLKAKTGKEISEWSRLEFLEKFLANNFVSSDAEENTSGPLKRGGVIDVHLLLTLFVMTEVVR